MSTGNSSSIPYGYCHCGCGGKTNPITTTVRSLGNVKGEPHRFLKGHHNRLRRNIDFAFVEQDHGYESPCWIWTAASNKNGYAIMGELGKSKLAHRVKYEQRYGKLTPKVILHHKCEVKLCVNPEHLEPMTHAEHGTVSGKALARQFRESRCPHCNGRGYL